MSEYQYYEFRTIDRELTDAEMKKMSDFSSRAEITKYSAAYVYNWGDFPGNPEHLMRRYFDMMLYMANWGSRRLMIKLPKSAVDKKKIKKYLIENEISLIPASDNIIIDLFLSPEDIDIWVDGEEWLDNLTGLREELLQGDYRVLYLAWLKSMEINSKFEKSKPDFPEPPVPPRLKKLSKALNDFADFLELDRKLLSKAAERSENLEEVGSLEKWIAKLSAREKMDFLIRLYRGEANLSAKLYRHLYELAGRNKSSKLREASHQRRVSA